MDRFRRSYGSLSLSSWGQPLDRAAVLVIAMLTVVIVALLVFGDRTAPRVRDFSWNDKRIGSEDKAFILTFNRPMDRKSVEENLHLDALFPDAPPQTIPGKISWAGQRMAYTLEEPAPYGYEFSLTLENARDRFSQPGPDAETIVPFTASFRSRDRALFYIGIQGDEAGRLVLFNLTQNEKRILTPDTLTVLEYEPYPSGEYVVISAIDRNADDPSVLDQQIYNVATGLTTGLTTAETPGANGEDNLPDDETKTDVSLIVGSENYKNVRFDLAPDGQSLVVYRVSRQNPNDFGLWMVRPDQPAEPLNTEPGGEFLITPDSQAIAYLQGEGLAILPLPPTDEDTTTRDLEVLEFLPEYGGVLDFAPDGSQAATVQFSSEGNQPRRSLFLVTNRGQEQELFTTDGSILDAQFDPAGQYLYCIITQLASADFYLEQPYLIAIDLKTAEFANLLLLPQQQTIHMSVAPDGLGLLFDQVESTTNPDRVEKFIPGKDGSLITDSQLWFFPLSRDDQNQLLLSEPDRLPFAGLSPQWLP